LDAVSGILASHFYASQNISTNTLALKQYHSVFVTVLNFVIDKLNDKDKQQPICWYDRIERLIL
jgi:hypothetical protein